MIADKLESKYFPTHPMVYNPAEFATQIGLSVATNIILESKYFPTNPILYNLAVFVTQIGLFIATNITGVEVTMCFQITAGIIIHALVIDYGHLALVCGNIVTCSKDELGGYIGSSSTVSLTSYPSNNQDYYYYCTICCVSTIKLAFSSVNDCKGLITTSST